MCTVPSPEGLQIRRQAHDIFWMLLGVLGFFCQVGAVGRDWGLFQLSMVKQQPLCIRKPRRQAELPGPSWVSWGEPGTQVPCHGISEYSSQCCPEPEGKAAACGLASQLHFHRAGSHGAQGL